MSSNNLEFLAILNVLNAKLDNKLVYAIKNNLLSEIHVSSPDPAISMEVLGDEMVISDNREIVISSTRNPILVIKYLFKNIYMLICHKYLK